MVTEIKRWVYMNENGSIKVSIGMVTISVLLIIQIVIFSFGYGVLTQQVASNRELISSYQTNQSSIMEKLDDLTTRMTRLEVTISEKTQ